MKAGRVVKIKSKGPKGMLMNIYTDAEDPYNEPISKAVEIISSNFDLRSNYPIRKYTNWPDSKPLPIALQNNHSRAERHWGIPYYSIFDDFWLWGDREWYALSNTDDLKMFPVRTPEQKLWKLGMPYLYLDKIDLPRKGTLVIPKGEYFPDNRVSMGLIETLEFLKKLPAKFKPITVLLRMESVVRKDQHKIVEAAGLEWVCLGWGGRDVHCTSLQKIFSSHEYATTDYPGSPRHLALYFGCKFFYPHRNIPGYGKKAIQSYYMRTNNGEFLSQNWAGIIDSEFEHFCIDNVEESFKSDYAKEVINHDMGLQYKKSPKQLTSILSKLAEKEVYKYMVETAESLFNETQDKAKNQMYRLFMKQLIGSGESPNWEWLVNNKFLLMKHKEDFSKEFERTWHMLAKIRYKYLSYDWVGHQRLEFKPPRWVKDINLIASTEYKTVFEKKKKGKKK